MATKNAEIIVEVDDQSLVELNDQIKELEVNIKNLKIGTAEWYAANKKLGELKTQFRDVTKEAVKLQNVVDKPAITDRIRGTLKLAQGLTGAFAAASSAAKLFGGTGEEFDEIQAKATLLLDVMYGLNRVTKLFSKEGINDLKSIGAGFGKLVTSVKTASTGMKAALISTGIGALIVGVGLLIANFDKLKNLFSGAEKEAKKLAEQNYAAAQQYTKLSQQQYDTEKKRIETEKYRTKLYGDSRATAKADADAAYAYEKLIGAQIGEEIALQAKLTQEKKKAKAERKTEIDAEIALSKERQNGLDYELKLANRLRIDADNYETISQKVYDINEALRKNQNALIVLNSENYKSREIYLNQLDTLEKQKKAIYEILDKELIAAGARSKLTKEEQDQVDVLNAQITALKNQETERQRVLKLQLEQLSYERTIENAIAKTNEKYAKIKDALNAEYDFIQANKKGYEDQINIFELQKKKYDELAKKKEALINFDERGVGMLYEQNQELEDQLLSMNELFSQAAAMINIQLEGRKYDEDKIDAAAKELAFFKQIADATIAKLQNDKLLLDNRKEALNVEREQLQVQGGALEMQKKHYEAELKIAKSKLEAAKSDEERKARLEEVVDLEAKVNDLNSQILDVKSQITDVNGQIASTENEILTTTQDIDATTQSIVDKNKELADTIEQQSRTYQQMQDFVGKYGEEIQVSAQALAASIEFIAALQDRKAQEAQDRIDEYQDQLDALEEQEDDRASKLEEYEELLKDANGERYNELLRLIEQEKAAQMQAETEKETQREAIEAKIKDEENKKLAAEARAAKWRKAQALIDAVIQGALAVIKALPNVFLAVATGVLAAAGIATIAAQKTPDIPKGYASGGVVDKGGLIMVGEKGFELAEVPAKTRIYNHEDSVAMLASGRLPKAAFAEGGTYTPPVVSTGSSNLIDYDKMATAFYSAVMRMPNPVVSVQKITTAQREVSVTKQAAGL